MLKYCLRSRSNPPSTRRRPRKTIVPRGFDPIVEIRAPHALDFSVSDATAKVNRLIGAYQSHIDKRPIEPIPTFLLEGLANKPLQPTAEKRGG